MHFSLRRMMALPALMCVMLLAAVPYALADNAVSRSLDTQEAAEGEAQQSQARIDALDDETRELLQRYRAAEAEAEALESYNRQVARLVESQQAELASQREQRARMAETNQAILPHMGRLLDTFERFVERDLPFLPDERSDRVETLRAMMDRADVTVAEKYRRLLEAYSVEMEYGRTIEAYQGKLDQLDGDDARSVTFLRVGRVALLYQTQDAAHTGYWDAASGAFVRDDSYRDAVRTGLRIARRQAAPGLLAVPVAAPRSAE